VRPEFFTDPVMASLSAVTRLTYIGLWCVADDAGWLRWDVPQIGAQLYPYESARRREKVLSDALSQLMEKGRVVLHPCECVFIPHLVDHQKIGGNKNINALILHRVHTGMDQSPGRVGNGKVGNVRVERERETQDGAPSLKQRLGEFPELLKVVR
jgi:hypothetical protein